MFYFEYARTIQIRRNHQRTIHCLQQIDFQIYNITETLLQGEPLQRENITHCNAATRPHHQSTKVQSFLSPLAGVVAGGSAWSRLQHRLLCLMGFILCSSLQFHTKYIINFPLGKGAPNKLTLIKQKNKNKMEHKYSWRTTGQLQRLLSLLRTCRQGYSSIMFPTLVPH